MGGLCVLCSFKVACVMYICGVIVRSLVLLGEVMESFTPSFHFYFHLLNQMRSCEYLSGLLYSCIISATFYVTGVSGNKSLLPAGQRRIWTYAHHISCEFTAHHEGVAYKKRECLPVCVQGTSFLRLCSLEVTHAKFRTYQTETQNSEWFMNAMVRGSVLLRCFFPPEPSVCLPVIVLYRVCLRLDGQ